MTINRQESIWIRGFLYRSPEFRLMKGRKIDSESINGANADTDTINALFTLLNQPVIPKIKPPKPMEYG